MELKHLASFLAVAEQLSFVRAARQIHLSQPALSGQIQRLEEELGVRLLERNRRSVKLTDAGRVFLAEARLTLEAAEQAVERARGAARGEIGRLRIAFVSSAALEIVPALVLAFRTQHPGVRLELTNRRTTDQVKALLNETLDVGLVRMPLEHARVSVRTIHREPFVMVLPKGHAAARLRVRLSDLRDESFVAYGRRWAPGFYDTVIGMCRHAGFSPRIVQETGEMYTAISLVAAGVGVAVLPRSVVLAQSAAVVMKPLPETLGVSEIAIAMRRNEPSELIHSFVTFAAEFAPKYAR
jgi:DNA-binding transcriptional LysR family regulator